MLDANGGDHAYLGLDVHTKATVWHLLDREGQTVETGKTTTTGPPLTTLVRRCADQDELLVGQEVGKMAYLVHDVLTAAKVRVLAFNAWHLRMVASSRKKTDRRGRLLAGEDPANGDESVVRRIGAALSIVARELKPSRSRPRIALQLGAIGA